jgi:hypothetical protein
MKALRPLRLLASSLALAGSALAATQAISAAAARSAGSQLTHATSTPKAIDMFATYYGWYDNTPPGCATAYAGCAGGTGTYAHPITFASDKAELPVGSIIYYPTLEKYFVMGDDCQECDEDWSGKGPDGGPGLYHVDLWIGGKGGNEFDAINCEDALTQGTPSGSPLLTPFIVHPPANLPVSTEPIFNAKTGACYGGAQTSTSYGRYRNAGTGQCLVDPGDRTTPGTTAGQAPCGLRPAEDLTFDGAFFTVNNLCLQSIGFKTGARITFAACNGGPEQQWSINPNGTITGIQYGGCLADSAGTVELDAKCALHSAEQWVYTEEPKP